MGSDTVDEQELEKERTKNFLLGRIAELEDAAERLRERSGEAFAEADRPRETRRAGWLKEMAREFEDEAERRREAWEERYE